MHTSKLGTWGGTLIIAGTSIGVGMLGLPVVTGPSGFIPSLTVLLVSWAFMTITGLLFVELCLWIKQEVNIISMANKTFGNVGKIAAWLLYIFLFYCLTIAYLVGGGNILGDMTENAFPSYVRILLFAAVFISFVAMGKKIVDPLNRALMAGLFASYVGFLVIGFPSVKSELLLQKNWSHLLIALSYCFCLFWLSSNNSDTCKLDALRWPKNSKGLCLRRTHYTIDLHFVAVAFFGDSSRRRTSRFYEDF